MPHPLHRPPPPGRLRRHLPQPPGLRAAVCVGCGGAGGSSVSCLVLAVLCACDWLLRCCWVPCCATWSCTLPTARAVATLPCLRTHPPTHSPAADFQEELGVQALTDLFEVRWPALPGPGAASLGPAELLLLLWTAKPCASLLLSPPGPPARPPTQLASDGRLHVHAAQQQQMAAAVGRAAAVLAEGRYLHLPYTTLFEYLAVGVAGVGVWVGAGGGGGEGCGWDCSGPFPALSLPAAAHRLLPSASPLRSHHAPLSRSPAVPARDRGGAAARGCRRPLLPGRRGVRLLHALGRHGGACWGSSWGRAWRARAGGQGLREWHVLVAAC